MQKLFSKGNIGKMRLKNRVYMTAMTTGFAGKNGQPTDQLLSYYEERAKGGVGLIVTEIFKVNAVHGNALGNQLYALDVNNTPSLAQMTARIHKYGTRIVAQLHHGGSTNSPELNGGRLVGASAIPNVSGIVPEPLTLEEIEELKQQFIMTAPLCKAADFDGVELHCAHGYLLCEFLSASSNQRDDQYGGSLENRCRLPIEILQGIKAVCGPDFPVLIRYSVQEYDPGHPNSISLEEGVEMAKMFEAAGVDALDVSCGNYFTMYGENMETYHYEQGWRKDATKAVKDAVSIPVMGMNNIKEPEFAETLLEEGVCDFVGVGRGHIADPEWVRKAQTGRSAEIRKCMGCMYCFESLLSVGYARCAANPRMGREYSFREPPCKNGNGRPVAVIGGGPAGMQAASLLANRGFDVTLFEAQDALGGALTLAGSTAPYKNKMLKMRDTLALEVEKSGAKVCLGTKADVDTVAALNPVGVFIAAGAKPVVPPIPGIDNAKVVLANDVVAGKVKVSGKVVIAGSGLTGMETAEMISRQGDVTELSLVDMLPQIGAGLYPSIYFNVMRNLAACNAQMYPGHAVKSIDDKGITMTKVEDGSELFLEADYVILALGLKPDKAMIQAFDDKFGRVYVLGEANAAPGRIGISIADAYIAAYGFDPEA